VRVCVCVCVYVCVCIYRFVADNVFVSALQVPDAHLDSAGISNLRVPLDVGEARECSDNSGEKAIVSFFWCVLYW